MITTAAAAATAICILLPPLKTGWSKSSSHGGSLREPTTLSRMIFSGHGPATLITVCTTIATRMIDRVTQYGRTRLRIRRNTLNSPDWPPTRAGSKAPEFLWLPQCIRGAALELLLRWFVARHCLRLRREALQKLCHRLVDAVQVRLRVLARIQSLGRLAPPDELLRCRIVEINAESANLNRGTRGARHATTHPPTASHAVRIPLLLLLNGGLNADIHIGSVRVGLGHPFSSQLGVNCVSDLLHHDGIHLLGVIDGDPFISMVFRKIGTRHVI